MNHSTLFHFNYRHIFKACSSHYGSIRKCWLSKSTVYFMGSATGFCLKVILLSFPLSVFGSWNIVRSVCFVFFSHQAQSLETFFPLQCHQSLAPLSGTEKNVYKYHLFPANKTTRQGLNDTPVLEVRKVVTCMRKGQWECVSVSCLPPPPPPHQPYSHALYFPCTSLAHFIFYLF